MVLLAVGEWGRYGKQVITYSTDAPPRTEQLGIKERDAPQRIADYWAAVGNRLNGLNDVPWSAAFISWDIASAGVPRDLFCPDQRHTIYVERIVERAKKPGAAFIPHEPDAYAPKVGDLVCASRDASGTTLQNLNRGCPAGSSFRDRRQRRRLGYAQCLSTGRRRVFIAHFRSSGVHGDRKSSTLGKVNGSTVAL